MSRFQWVRSIFGVFVRVFGPVFGFFARLLGALFGSLSWSAPSWLRYFLSNVVALAGGIRRHPGPTALAVTGSLKVKDRTVNLESDPVNIEITK